MLKDNILLANIPDITENSPYISLRLVKVDNIWQTSFASKNISQLGYKPEDMTSGDIKWLDLIHVDDKVTIKRQIYEYGLKGIHSFKLYYRIKCKNGQVIPIAEHRTVHHNIPKNIECYDSFVFNNTQEASSQQSLDNGAVEQAILRDIFISLQDNTPDVSIQLILSRVGEYLNVSRALLFMDNADHTTCKISYEWCNRDIESLFNLDMSINYEKSMPDIYAYLQSIGMMLINHGEIPESCKVEFEEEGLKCSAIFAVYLDGAHYGFVCFDDCIIERRWDEETARFLKTISNIISNTLYRKYTSDKLESSRKTYESVLNNVDSYIFVAEEQQNTIIFANNAFKKSFGHHCLGRPIKDFLPIDTLALPNNGEDNVGGNDYPELYSLTTKEWLAITKENITWIDESQVSLFTCYDITAKKNFYSILKQRIEERTHELKLMAEEARVAQEKAEGATKAKSHFLANMSHEIRTPMNAILGLSERLTKSNLKEKHLDYAKNIHRSSTVLLNIINDILDISILEANKVVLVNIHYSLTQSLEHIASLLHSMTDDKNIIFTMLTSDKMPTYLYGDDIRLRQILINLLSNGIKYTEKGSVQLVIEVFDDSMTFSVVDTGIGINEDDLDHIFEPFAQVDIQKHRALQRTGLGLPICRKLAKLMEGTITASSTYGQGSTFTLTIPKILGDPNKVLSCVEDNKLRLTAPDAKILVVDDIDINLYVAETLLESFDIHISTAKSGQEALTLTQSNSFDVIFMDHLMPDMDGIETTKAIRNLSDDFLYLPIIALTANAMTNSQKLFKDAGMNDFIAKPIELAKLQIVLERWLPPSKIIWKNTHH